jgi:hypothetical protein
LPVVPLRLASLYSYFGDDGMFRTWGEGTLVTDPTEISDLIARGAPVERIDA